MTGNHKFENLDISRKFVQRIPRRAICENYTVCMVKCDKISETVFP